MKKYIGTKTVMAEAMTKSEAETILNRNLSDAKGGEDGYLVEYEDGYKSWSPKETFEAAYKIAETYIDSMQIEHGQLKERILKLHKFILSEDFLELDTEEQALLQRQYNAMDSYTRILTIRLHMANRKANTPRVIQRKEPCNLCSAD